MDNLPNSATISLLLGMSVSEIPYDVLPPFDRTPGIADTGIDFDNCYFRGKDDVADVPINRCNYTSRKIVCYFQTMRFSDDIDAHGHGTHVSATAAGLHYRTSSSGNPSPTNLIVDENFRNGMKIDTLSTPPPKL